MSKTSIKPPAVERKLRDRTLTPPAPPRRGRPTSTLGLRQADEGWTIRPRMPDGRRPELVVAAPGATEALARDRVAAWLERRPEMVAAYMAERSAAEGAPPPSPDVATVQSFGEDWTSGRLVERFGEVDGLRRVKASAYSDRKRLEREVYPRIGKRPIADVTTVEINEVLGALPAHLAHETRTQYRKLLSMLFRLAERPAGLRPHGSNPVTHASRPTPTSSSKLFLWLRPDEVLALLACASIPIARRVAYALGAYTGLRKGSLLSLAWRDVDTAHAVVTARKTKTGHPVTFAVEASLVRLLVAWRAHLGEPRGDVLVLPPDALYWQRRGKERAAVVLREDLGAAGVKRELLFTADPEVEPIRFHDLRATFATWAKRAGRDDGWITDRTGHTDAETLALYTRAARELADLQIDPFPSLAGAVPELAALEPAGPEYGRDLDADRRRGALDRWRRRRSPPRKPKGPETLTVSEPVGASGFEPPTPRPPV